jgi:DNA-binding transcriptional regulator YiaG
MNSRQGVWWRPFVLREPHLAHYVPGHDWNLPLVANEETRCGLQVGDLPTGTMTLDWRQDRRWTCPECVKGMQPGSVEPEGRSTGRTEKGWQTHAIRSDIGAELRRLRQFVGLSQMDVATLCGVDVSTISRWERGRHQHTHRSKDRLIRAALQALRSGRTTPDSGAGPSAYA